MQKTIYSVNAIRDKITGAKPAYSRLSDFINGNDNTLTEAEYEAVKTIVKKQYDIIVERADKYVAELRKSKK